MSALEICLLVVAGLLGGGINSIAGGGSLVVFPALLAVGMPPLQANVTNSVAQWPGYLGGVWGFRAELGTQKHRVRQLVAVSVLGSVVGCVLLLTLPDAAFDAIVPALVLLASALLAFQPRLKRWAEGRKPTQATEEERHQSERRRTSGMYVAVFFGAVYGGYFGGAVGVILIGVLALTIPDTLRRINALKSAIALVVSTVTVVAFGIFGPVEWIAVAAIAPAALVGGVLGAKIARRIRDDVLRWIVVTLGVGVAIYLIFRAVRGG